jgi:hypothetical protein
VSKLSRSGPQATTLVIHFLAASAYAGGFTEEAQFGIGSTFAIAWGDSDGDGDPDLAVSNFPGDNELYINNGDGTFTGQAQFRAGTADSFSAAWGDYDNDGDQDMAIGRPGVASNHLYVNNGNGTFTQQTRFGTGRAVGLAWADFDRDGDLDLAVARGILGADQQNHLYVNNGNGTFTERDEFGGLQSAAAVWGDYDNDGDADMAIGNGGFGQQQQNYLYRNNGDGTFTEFEEFGTGDTAALAWGDCDNDGDLDMAVGNWDATQCKLYVNNGDGSFTGRDEFGARDTNTLNWGDYNNDGLLDLAVGNGDFQSGEQNYLYVNTGNCTFTEVAEFGLGSTDGIAWADYDLDGDLDVASGNEHSPTTNYLYVNNRDLNDSLTLHLVGRYHELGAGYSNRNAIGARVYAYATGHMGEPAFLLGFREVEAHGGLASQNHIDPHFGLAGRSDADIRIIWPGSFGDQVVQDLPAVAVGQILTVFEGDQVPPAAATPPADAQGSERAKNRFISVVVPAGEPGDETAIRVRLTSLHHPPSPPGAPNFSAFEGDYRYVRLFRDGSNNPIFDCLDSATSGSTYKCATLGCTPEYRDWAAELGGQVLHITGPSVIPSSIYDVAQLGTTCTGIEATCLVASNELSVQTVLWGNVDNNPALNAIDISAVVDKVKDLPSSLPEWRAMLQPNSPTPHTNQLSALDIAQVVNAIKGIPYGFAGPESCP